MFRVHTIRTGEYADGFGRTYRSVHTSISRQPSWLLKLSALAGVLVFVGVVLLLIVPAIVVAAVVFAAAWLGLTIKQRVLALFRPNGAMDGRRNVRVIDRGDR